MTDHDAARPIRTWTIRVLLVVLNALLFLVAWAGGLSLRPLMLDVPIWGSLGGEYAVIAASASLAFMIAGAIARLWSRHWSMVAFPALVAFEVGLTLLAMAIYLGDGGSEGQMWTVIWPEGRAWAAGAVAASFAVAGYLAASRLTTRPRAGVDGIA